MNKKQKVTQFISRVNHVLDLRERSKKGNIPWDDWIDELMKCEECNF